MVRMDAVRSPPRSSQAKSQLRLPRTSFRNSRSTRLFVSSMFPSRRKSTRRFPLPMEVAERGAEWCPRRNGRSLVLEPQAESFHHRLALLRPPREPLRRVVTVERALPFHEEERPDQAQSREPDLVAGPSSLDEPAARVRPTSRGQAACALGG